MTYQTTTTMYIHRPTVKDVRRINSEATASGDLFIVDIGTGVTLIFDNASALKAFISDLSTKRAELPVSV